MKKKSKKRLWLYKKKWLAVGSFCGTVCKSCGEPLLLYYKYDADCCPRCDLWVEKKCKDPECIFCKARPETPSIALLLNKNTAQVDFFIHKYEKRHKRLNRRILKQDIRERKEW